MGKQQALEAIVEYLKGDTVELAPAVPPRWAISQLFLEILNTLEIDPATKVRVPACGYMPWGSGKPIALSSPICDWALSRLADANFATMRGEPTGVSCEWVENRVEELVACLVIATFFDARILKIRQDPSLPNLPLEAYESNAHWYLWRITLNRRNLPLCAKPPRERDALQYDEINSYSKSDRRKKISVSSEFTYFILHLYDALEPGKTALRDFLRILDKFVDFRPYIGKSVRYAVASERRNVSLKYLLDSVRKKLEGNPAVRLLGAHSGPSLSELLKEDLQDQFDGDLSECRPLSKPRKAVKQIVDLVVNIARESRRTDIRFSSLKSAIYKSLDLSRRDIRNTADVTGAEAPTLAIDREASARIRAALEKLSAREKYVFIQRAYYDQEHNSIAQCLSISVRHTRNIFNSVKKRLQKELGPYFDLPGPGSALPAKSGRR
ncbi:MAG: sigma-70 family RNA polymerase sigma factor [Planctomycetes bacterium]|nr:sigma-70 family RNA polymerase sigma factor [Planctomycetota bacterium]